MANKDIYI